MASHTTSNPETIEAGRSRLRRWSAVIALCAAVGFFVALAPPAHAIDLDTVTCNWQNAVGGTNISFPGSGTPSCEVRWGDDAGSGQSGLGFDGLAPQLGLALNTPFEIGSLLHFNAPILFGTSSTSADLRINLDLSQGAESFNPSFTFTFAINETLNTGPGCCDDVITFPAAFPSENFTIGGELFTLQLLGFGGSPNTLSPNFISPEGLTNEAQLWARIVQVKQVAEPASWLLLATGLLALAMRRRRLSLALG
jgi:hypothetical protein